MMRAAGWLLLGAWAAQGAAASGPTFHYGFSDCVDDARSLFYFLKSEATCQANATGEVLAKRK
jgi:hypothetical protein